MRVTERYTTRNYLNNLNTAQTQMSKSQNRLTTGRNYEKISEDVSSGERALTVRTSIYKNQQIQDNVLSARESLESTEDVLMNIKDTISNIHSQTIKAVNGTNDTDEEHEIFATTFNSVREQVLQFANTKYNNQYSLGATNNTDEAPFAFDEDGDVTFNGVKVKDVVKEDSKYYDSEGTRVPYSKDIYIDVGLGLSVKDGEIDPRTGFKVTVSGLDALGYGTSEITYEDANFEKQTIESSNNIIEIVGEIADALLEGDNEKAMALDDHLSDRLSKLTLTISDVGTRENYLDNTTAKLEDDEYTMIEMQTNLEKISDTDEIVNYSSLSYSWQLTLQYGAKMIPQSLMDYVS